MPLKDSFEAARVNTETGIGELSSRRGDACTYGVAAKFTIEEIGRGRASPLKAPTLVLVVLIMSPNWFSKLTLPHGLALPSPIAKGAA
jgi:hypothetical protein